MVEETLSLCANRFMKDGVLKAGNNFGGATTWTVRSGKLYSIGWFSSMTDPRNSTLKVFYTTTRQEKVENLNYSIRLESTQPQFGGLRWWFRCPLSINGVPCNRRVGKLYLPLSSLYIGCRHCHNLTYKSCQQGRTYDSILRRLNVRGLMRRLVAKSLLRGEKRP